MQPTLAFGISGYLLYPDWDNQTALSRAFDPIFVVMLVAGLVATMIGTVVLPISRAQRAIGLPLALLLYAGAFLAGSVIGCVLWGLPID